MSTTDALAHRIDAEFAALEEKQKKEQLQNLEEYRARQQRLKQFGATLENMRDLWKPRLELLVNKFGERVKVTPNFQPANREATFEFQSSLARVRLRFAASANRDITGIVLSSDLEIVPILMQFDAHSEIEFPLDAINRDAVGRWLDDRIVAFVKTFLALHQNDYYLKDEMVEDPIAKVRFPKFAAGATLDWQGKSFYFVGEETRREFQQQNGIQ